MFEAVKPYMKRTLLIFCFLFSAVGVFAQSSTDVQDGRTALKKESFSRSVVSEIYPNPANTSATIELSVNQSVSSVKISVSNVIGTQIYSIEVAKTERRIVLSTEDLQEGVYFYSLILDGKKEFTRRLIVRH